MTKSNLSLAEISRKRERVQDEVWKNHCLCFRDDCNNFSRSNIRNLHPSCLHCKEHYNFIIDIITRIVEGKSLYCKDEYIHAILRKYRKYCIFIEQKKKYNFELRKNIREKTVDPKEPMKYEHNNEEDEND